MSASPWWKTGVIYEVPVPSFSDSDGDGLGDIRGVIDRLGYLKDDGPDSRSLGVDAVWLTPVNASPMRDFGYDVADYFAIEPRLGTMADFESLVRACHERGVRLVMDLVLNHTSEDHPWFKSSRATRHDPKRDWYIWRDGRRFGRPPNRWVSVAEGKAWTHDTATGQYYYHAFLEFQPDLNWRNPDVRRQMIEVVEFWLGKGVDGFRLDLVNFLYEDELCRDNPPAFGHRPYFWQRHLHDRSQPESLVAVKQLRKVIDRYPNRAMMGEVCSDERIDTVDYLGDGSDALHLAFYLDFARCPWKAEAFRDSVGWLESHVPPGAWPCYYLNNHDLERSFTRYGRGRHAEARSKVAAAMLLTVRGTPVIYCGEEIGMPTSKVPRRAMHDPLGKLYWPLSRGRDGSRTPMQWDASHCAGFTDATPWLPVDASYVTVNVETQQARADSVLNWYRTLIRVRREHTCLQIGTYQALPGTPKGVWAYVRESAGERVTVALNFTPRPVTVPDAVLPRPLAKWRTLASSNAVRADLTRTALTLAPYEALLLEAIT